MGGRMETYRERNNILIILLHNLNLHIINLSFCMGIFLCFWYFSINKTCLGINSFSVKPIVLLLVLHLPFPLRLHMNCSLPDSYPVEILHWFSIPKIQSPKFSFISLWYLTPLIPFWKVSFLFWNDIILFTCSLTHLPFSFFNSFLTSSHLNCLRLSFCLETVPCLSVKE